MDVVHDGLKLPVDLLARPGDAQGVLALLQAGHGNAPRVGRLGRAEQDLPGKKRPHRSQRGRHVGAFGHRQEPVVDQGFRVVGVQLVLRGAGQGELAGDAPRPLLLVVLAAEVLGVLVDPSPANLLELLQPRQTLGVDAVRVVDEAVRIRGGDDGGAQLVQLLDGVEGDVAGAGDDRRLAGDFLVAGRQHVLQEVDRPVAGGLGPHQAAAERQALAGEDAGEAVRKAHVLAEQEPYLARADAYVAGGDVGVLADVAVQLPHHRLTETHDLVGAAAARAEVRATLGAPHRQAGEAVLEDLLEAQELQHALRDRGVEAQAALVGADDVAELHAPGPRGADAAPIVLPGHPERDDPVGFGEPFQDARLFVLGMRHDERDDALGHLPDGLMELGLARVAADETGHEFLQPLMDARNPVHSPASSVSASRDSLRAKRAFLAVGAQLRQRGTFSSLAARLLEQRGQIA